jgi:protein phosphatase
VAGIGPHEPDAADPEELRYAPRPPSRFRWVRRLAVLVVIVGLVVLAGRFAYGWTQEQYYVSDNGNTVAIYQGIQAEVPLVSLSSLHEESDIELSTLPDYWRTRVHDGIDATDLTNAHNIVRQLRDTARACAQEQQPTPTKSASPSPTDSPTSGPTDRPTSDRDQRRRADRQAGSARDNQSSPTSSPSPTGEDKRSGEPTSQPTTEPGCAGATS